MASYKQVENSSRPILNLKSSQIIKLNPTNIEFYKKRASLKSRNSMIDKP